MNGKFSRLDDSQSGFTLVEMLVALAIIMLLALCAHTLSRLSFMQLSYFKQPASLRDDAMLQSWRWLENDILQIRGDYPWKMDGSLDADSCLLTWTFTTENQPAIALSDRITTQVRYRVDNHRLLREEIGQDGEVVSAPETLLQGVECIHPRFWQMGRWSDKPSPGTMIRALSLTLHWQGPTVERVWPVEIPYDAH